MKGCGYVLVLSLAIGAGCERPEADAVQSQTAGLTSAPPKDQPLDPARGLLLEGTVVTMNAAHDVLERGEILIRDGRIVAIWQRGRPPAGTPIGDAVRVDLGPSALIFPGLINLHNHPTYDMLSAWAAPSSHVQPALGRPLGTEPYANRYQWNGMHGNASPEERRLLESPQLALTSPSGLGLAAEVVKYARVKSLVGGETTQQGGPSSAALDGILARNVESTNFGRQKIGSFVPAIDTVTDAQAAQLIGGMQAGLVDAWLFHLAEGVRDSDRRPGDLLSSRAEFAVLEGQGLLTDMTVIVHGSALEPQDFAHMRAARSIRADGAGDGLGAKLVWSPLSNLLLYGRTANVYQALAAGVTVSLGTDWSPSGSRNLLGELKVADLALRDASLLGTSRALVPGVSVAGKRGHAAAEAEVALDRLIVDMATRNPAATLRWTDQVGSLEAGKVADLFVVTPPEHSPCAGLPSSPYRSLIDATERDVRLVLVGGDPLVGDLAVMQRLKPGDHEVITSVCGGYRQAVDVTKTGVPLGDETLADIERQLNDALIGLGGDHPPAAGGPADATNTYSFLKSRIPGASALSDELFRQLVLVPIAGTIDGTPAAKLNLERLTLTPLLTEDDGFFFDLVGGRVDPVTHTIDDATPPYLLYPSNVNQAWYGADPFSPARFQERWYSPARRGRAPEGACSRR